MKKKLILFVCLFFVSIFMSFSVKVFAFPSSSNILLNGIDVSEWQGNIDFETVKASGIDTVYIKSSEGDNYIDPYFMSHYNNAKNNGFNIGFYHFLTASSVSDANAQAKFFASVINGLSCDCKLAMDFEIFNDLSIQEINDISLEFLSTVEELTGKEVVIYSDAYNARNTFNDELASRYPIWVADYGVSEPENGNWSTWEGFQYTNQGLISGISGYVDRDYFSSDILLSDKSSIDVPNSTSPIVNTDYVIVKYGNTLSQIALEYNTSYQYLAKVNNISNPNLIYIGERIYIPSIDNSDLHDTSHMLYIVKRGNTLSQISRLYDVSIVNIADLNHIINPNLIFAGQILRIPVIN